jgi:hypothetical protein
VGPYVYVAERSGFEPENRLKTHYPLSRRALSSTQPSLRADSPDYTGTPAQKIRNVDSDYLNTFRRGEVALFVSVASMRLLYLY